MYTIKTLNKISPIGLAALNPTRYEISDGMEDPDAILVRSAKMHDYAFNPKLKCIARAGAGTNNIPLERCTDSGIVVFNSPGANAESVKELVLCALLLSSRDIPGGMKWVEGLKNSPDTVAADVEKGKSQFAGPEIMGKTLGVVGLGAIGAKVAAAALSLGMNVYGYDPYLSVKAAWRLSSEVQHAGSLEVIYRNCDYITLHLPYMESTKEIIDSAAIAQMKDGVRLINLARGELVCDNDMLAALESGKVARYVTDFPNGKTAAAKNVIAFPHLGASTPESEDNCAIMAAQEIAEYLETGNIRNSVNLPAAYLEPSGNARLCVIHRNLPAVIKGMLEVVSGAGINVENMTSKARDKHAYCIMDLNAPVGDEQLAQIRSVGGVLGARVIVH